MTPTFFFGQLKGVQHHPNGSSTALCPVRSEHGRSIIAGVLQGGLKFQCSAGCSVAEIEDALARADQVRSNELAFDRLDSVSVGAVRWLWPGQVPLGKVTMLAGEGGVGKSLIAVDMAARVTGGQAWPGAAGEAGDGQRVKPGWAMMLAAEDDMADMIRPRLEAAGGDAARLIVVQAAKLGPEVEGPLDLRRDLPALTKLGSKVVDLRLIVIDPITAYLGGPGGDGVTLARPLARLARTTGAAVLCVHRPSRGERLSPLGRASGGFTGSARQVLAAASDGGGTGRRVMVAVKSNLLSGVSGLAYRVESG
ncbi:MAG: AAA family ATPase, partial [Phycisphaerae bacterium]|nr:AAA family ATPase [Phycisphaerae bacterium]